VLPEQVDGYQVLRELGRGGMGVVYAVRDRAADRELALKLVHDLGDAVALLRFRREGELLARLRHRSVLRVHSCGETPQGPYLLTDLVPGVPLPRLLGGGPLAPRAAALLVRDLADGVAACHASSLLHRDLKPANVMVRPEGTPVILDFGVARDVRAGGLTATGELLGTPSHMAPEQALGQPVDGRADVWGLGTILYECLAGRAPFHGTTLVALVEQVCTTDPPWPSTLAPGVPPALEAVLRRAMARELADRTPSAVALRDDLDRWLGGVAGAPRGRRAPLTVAGLAAVGLAALGLAVALRPRPDPVVEARDLRPAPSPATAPAPRPRLVANPPARIDWSARILSLEVEPRPLELLTNHEAGLAMDPLIHRWRSSHRLDAEEWVALTAFADRGFADAQHVIAEQLLPLDPRGGLELLWRASRGPQPHAFAGWELARFLGGEGPPELRDLEGARWLLAEMSARWVREGGNTDGAMLSAISSLELDTDADLARALRILRRPADSGRTGMRETLARRVHLGEPTAATLLGLCLIEGWSRAAGVDAAAEVAEGERLLASDAGSRTGPRLVARWRALGPRLCEVRDAVDLRVELALDAPAPRLPGP
jgi:hypothetical protein